MTISSVVAAFDFDHTLSDRDSLLYFLFYMQGAWKTSYHLMTLGPAFARFILKDLSRQEIKEKILTRCMGGHSLEEIQAFGQDYAEKKLDDYLKSEALERIIWHQSQGHRCLIVSANLEVYLKPWALRHGFENVLASQLEVTPSGDVTGCLAGLNCWGPEKERRLLAYLGPKDNYELYVYGDSRGDQELLALADHPFYRKFHS